MADTKFMSFTEVTPAGTDSVLVGDSTNGVRRAQLSNLKEAIGGGIVAESIGTNGYIRYANGLIVQWGAIDMGQQATTTTVQMPISFPTRGIAGFAGSIDKNFIAPCGVVVNKDTITIKTSGPSSWTNWVAIGF